MHVKQGRAITLLKTVREGEAPGEPQTMESVIFPAAQQELRPPQIAHFETSKSPANRKTLPTSSGV